MTDAPQETLNVFQLMKWKISGKISGISGIPEKHPSHLNEMLVGHLLVTVM